jgi:hypothetical protein
MKIQNVNSIILPALGGLLNTVVLVKGPYGMQVKGVLSQGVTDEGFTVGNPDSAGSFCMFNLDDIRSFREPSLSKDTAAIIHLR